jgi:hypothetical protein
VLEVRAQLLSQPVRRRVVATGASSCLSFTGTDAFTRACSLPHPAPLACLIDRHSTSHASRHACGTSSCCRLTLRRTTSRCFPSPLLTTAALTEGCARSSGRGCRSSRAKGLPDPSSDGGSRDPYPRPACRVVHVTSHAVTLRHTTLARHHLPMTISRCARPLNLCVRVVVCARACAARWRSRTSFACSCRQTRTCARC